jgi:hypothetical protein
MCAATEAKRSAQTKQFEGGETYNRQNSRLRKYPVGHAAGFRITGSRTG